MNNIAVITTFGNQHFELYAKKMLQSFVQFWPSEIVLLVQLDDDLLLEQVKKILRPTDLIVVGRQKDHKDFIERNKNKDDPNDYRKQPVRFCHKVFSIKHAMDAAIKARSENVPDAPKYLIWLDADVHTTRKVGLNEIIECLPKVGDAVSYLGRKDWPHSECGWLAFDLENGGDTIINAVVRMYETDHIFKLDQWHDSWIFDDVRKNFSISGLTDKWTNLTIDKPGMDIWPYSAMGKWSTHFKGPTAKAQLVGHEQIQQPRSGSNIVIRTKNSIPNEAIHANIRTNQLLIKNWVKPCELNDEEIVLVSAGPSLIAEDVRIESGKKIVAVKHALIPLENAGIVPWACILLDPRPHVSKFVEKPDTRVKWFVASQVDPTVTANLLEAGCDVWGYHAQVGADEGFLSEKQSESIISGGSATATRGLYLLNHMGFRNFILYGYDLSYMEKPDLSAKDDKGQPKFLEMSVGYNGRLISQKRIFWTEPQLIAQFEEIDDMLKEKPFKIKAYGTGMVPYIVKLKQTSELREKELRAKLLGKKLPHYDCIWNNQKKMPYLTKLLRKLQPHRPKRMPSSS